MVVEGFAMVCRNFCCGLPMLVLWFVEAFDVARRSFCYGLSMFLLWFVEAFTVFRECFYCGSSKLLLRFVDDWTRHHLKQTTGGLNAPFHTFCRRRPSNLAAHVQRLVSKSRAHPEPQCPQKLATGHDKPPKVAIWTTWPRKGPVSNHWRRGGTRPHTLNSCRPGDLHSCIQHATMGC
jgi:hypothetical protein